jgi:hypothetical protein
MKTYFIIVAIIIASFLSGGCTTKENFDYKITVVPESKSSGITLNEMNTAGEIICKRMNNSFGFAQESMKLDVTENQISLTISKADTTTITSIKEIIIGFNRLEFRETYENGEIIGYLSKADNMLKDTLKTVGAVSGEVNKNQHLLFGILSPRINAGGEPLPSCMIGLVSKKDTSDLNRYLKIDQVKALFPADLKFYWSSKPYKYDTTNSLYGLHAIKVTTGNKQAPLDGSVIISAKVSSGSAGSVMKINLTMSDEGARTWAGITLQNINRCIAVIYNGYVISYPRVMNEISGGNTEITGNFTIKEAEDLVNILNSGQLPFKLKIVNEQILKSE